MYRVRIQLIHVAISSIPAGPQRVPAFLEHAEEPGAKLPALHHRQTPEALQKGPAPSQQVWSVCLCLSAWSYLTESCCFWKLCQNLFKLHDECFCTGEEHFPEALQLVKEQKLYSEALRLYSADSAHYKVRTQLRTVSGPCRAEPKHCNMTHAFMTLIIVFQITNTRNDKHTPTEGFNLAPRIVLQKKWKIKWHKNHQG